VSSGSGIGLKLIERTSNVEASLWRKYFIERKISYRDRLYVFHQDLAELIAKSEFRRRPRYGLDFEDFLQLATSGLLEAIDRFDPIRGKPFDAFARHRIKGAISDGIAKSSEAAAHYTFQRAQQNDRISSLIDKDEVVSNGYLGKLSDVVVGMAIGMLLEATALEQLSTSDPDPYECLALNEIKRAVLHSLSALPDPGRIVLRKHYLDGMPFTSIAQILNLTKGRVSQIHKEALGKLKTNFHKLDWEQS
jgi:RNA polymerase sigma factor FliA